MQWHEIFKNVEYIEVFDHKIPLNLTPLDQIQFPLQAYFPYPKGVVEVKGKDRLEFLNNLCTRETLKLENEQGLRALFTNKNGKILFDVFMVNLTESVLIFTDPGEEEKFLKHLEFFIIMEDVVLSLLDHHNFEVAYAFSNSLPAEAEDYWVLEERQDYKVLARPAELGLYENLSKMGLQPVGFQFFEQVRPLCGIARQGVDYSDEHLPQEAALEYAVNFQKGCYFGQEPISRITLRGNAKNLTRITLFVTRAFIGAGDPVMLKEEQVGMITSASMLETQNGYYSIGYLKQKHLEAELTIRDQPITAIELTG